MISTTNEAGILVDSRRDSVTIRLVGDLMTGLGVGIKHSLPGGWIFYRGVTFNAVITLVR